MPHNELAAFGRLALAALLAQQTPPADPLARALLSHAAAIGLDTDPAPDERRCWRIVAHEAGIPHDGCMGCFRDVDPDDGSCDACVNASAATVLTSHLRDHAPRGPR